MRLGTVVLAGGLGTRVRSLYPDRPKPLIPVAGRPFLDWVLLYLKSQGIGEAVIAAGFLGEQIEEHYRRLPVPGLAVRVAREPEPLGTAGGFLRAARECSPADAWLVVNGDTLFLAPLAAIVGQFASGPEAAAILAVALPQAGRYGRLEVDAGGRVTGFAGKQAGKQAGPGVVNAGMYLLRPSARDLFPPTVPLSFEQDVFPALAGRKLPVRAYLDSAPFLDMGTPESLADASAFIRRHAARWGASS